jgi:hypothetical protein
MLATLAIISDRPTLLTAGGIKRRKRKKRRRRTRWRKRTLNRK